MSPTSNLFSCPQNSTKCAFHKPLNIWRQRMAANKVISYPFHTIYFETRLNFGSYGCCLFWANSELHCTFYTLKHYCLHTFVHANQRLKLIDCIGPVELWRLPFATCTCTRAVHFVNHAFKEMYFFTGMLSLYLGTEVGYITRCFYVFVDRMMGTNCNIII